MKTYWITTRCCAATGLLTIRGHGRLALSSHSLRVDGGTSRPHSDCQQPTSLQCWSTLPYRDVGGFGAGSEFTWQLLTVVNDQVRDHLFLSAGCRQLNVDYRHHVQRLNLRMSGPVLGATLRF